MKTRLYLQITCLFILLATANTFAVTYTNTVSVGISYLCNQLDHGSNRADLVISSPVNLDGNRILKWTCAGYTSATYDSSSASGFSDALGNPIAAPILPTGEGFVFDNQSGVSVSLIFTGTVHTPTLP